MRKERISCSRSSREIYPSCQRHSADVERLQKAKFSDIIHPDSRDDFMDAPLTIEDLRECNTPKFLARFPSTDLLRINLNNVITKFEATSLKFFI